MSKKTVVLGASPNPSRASNMAVQRLVLTRNEVVAVGIREGDIAGVSIQQGQPMIDDVDTVSLYVGPANQPAYYDYITRLKPNRVIFNPGTFNPELKQLLDEHSIENENACMLVMLGTGVY